MSAHRASAAVDDEDDADVDADVRERHPKPAPGQALKAMIANTGPALMPPLQELITVARRECLLRERCYPKWLGDKFSEREACRELNGMRAILALLTKMAAE